MITFAGNGLRITFGKMNSKKYSRIVLMNMNLIQLVVFRSHYEDMVKLNSDFSPMLEGCLANRSKWVEIEEGKEDKNDSK